MSKCLGTGTMVRLQLKIRIHTEECQTISTKSESITICIH